MLSRTRAATADSLSPASANELMPIPETVILLVPPRITGFLGDSTLAVLAPFSFSPPPRIDMRFALGARQKSGLVCVDMLGDLRLMPVRVGPPPIDLRMVGRDVDLVDNVEGRHGRSSVVRLDM